VLRRVAELETLEGQRKAALGAQAQAVLARSSASQARAAEDGGSDWAQAEEKLKAAEGLLSEGKFVEAKAGFAEAEPLYVRAKDWAVAFEAAQAREKAAKAAAEESPWTNSLGMVFLPVPGTKVRFGVWDVRVQDFEAFVSVTRYDATAGLFSVGSGGLQQRGDTWKNPGFRQESTHPVCGVSWQDAESFCQWLTQKERNQGLLSPGQSYRLPKDAEWSVAVGLQEPSEGTPKDKNGKVMGVYPWGTQWPPPIGAGNYAGEEAKDGNWPSDWAVIPSYRDGYARTSPVGSFNPGKLGLYDMGGNVWQWCEDYYDGQGGSRVLRGGSWNDDELGKLLSSCRRMNPPDYRSVSFGFRCVLAADGSVR
jgi:formylglycine-generating enzyme required for sulfatase activity